MGLRLIMSSTDVVTYEVGQGVNCLTLEKQFTA